MHLKVVISLLLLLPIVSAGTEGQQSPASLVGQFRIEQDRPYVYLKFDHLGEAEPFSEDEPRMRIWFRLANNCRVPIVVRTFGVPEGHPDDEAGLFHDVLPNPEPIRSGVFTFPITPSDLASILNPSAKHEEEQKTKPAPPAPMPTGYGGDVSSTETIPPGKALLFSVPVTHLSKRWHMEIPFQFKLPKVKGHRERLVGGEPQMRLVYSIEDLPTDVQARLGGQ